MQPLELLFLQDDTERKNDGLGEQRVTILTTCEHTKDTHAGGHGPVYIYEIHRQSALALTHNVSVLYSRSRSDIKHCVSQEMAYPGEDE